jgi:hypothetical protein
MTKIIGFALLLAATSTALMAISAVPEIDASTGGSALAMIAGALLVVRGRRKK